MKSRITRRKFLKSTAAGSAVAAGGMAGILAQGRAPALAQATTVHWLRWNDFVPACDAAIREKILPEAEKALGIKVNFERVNGNDLQPRITSAIQSGAGPDIVMLFNNHPHLYQASLVDLSDIAEEIGKAQGGYYPMAKGNSHNGSNWISMPCNIVGGMNAYRTSLWKDVGMPAGPKTWDEYRAAGKTLKAKGFPVGQSLGQSFGDPVVFSYPFLWSFGGREVDEQGKVVLNSKETIEAVKYMTAFWKDSMDEGGLAWDDSSNNRAFLSGTLSATLNGASIYIEALRKPEQYKTDRGTPLKDDIFHGPLPAGPKGQFAMHTYQSHVIPNYSKNQKAAKELLKFFQSAANYQKWFDVGLGFHSGTTLDWEKSDLWAKDKIMEPYKVAGRLGQNPGYSGAPNAKAAEVLSKYLIGNMFAGAIKGQKAEDAVAACHAELVKIYGA
ncbi:MAG: ABC transporter substrate-binding protein [Hyphomicrobiaceae bacterium]